MKTSLQSIILLPQPQTNLNISELIFLAQVGSIQVKESEREKERVKWLPRLHTSYT